MRWPAPGQDALKQRGDLAVDHGDDRRYGLQCEGLNDARRGIDVDPGQQESTCRLRRQRGQRVGELLTSGHPRRIELHDHRVFDRLAGMTSASKVCSFTSTTYEPPPGVPAGAAAPACLARAAAWDRSTAPWRLKLDELMAVHPVKAAARLGDGPEPRTQENGHFAPRTPQGRS